MAVPAYQANASDAQSTRPMFDITPEDDDSSDASHGPVNEEERQLIDPGMKQSTPNAFRRVSTNCMHPKVPCPTCKGKGKLSQAQSDTMLALIPVHDNRLRPKRTTLKLGIVFCLILITGGLCFAFLFPRKVYFSINDVMVWRNISLTKKDVAMNLTVTSYLNNTNFFIVDVSNISVQILLLETIDRTPHEVGSVQLPSTVQLGIRENKEVKLQVTTLYAGKDKEHIEKNCNWMQENDGDRDYYFPIRVSITGFLKYWSHTEQIGTEKIYYIECISAMAMLKEFRDT